MAGICACNKICVRQVMGEMSAGCFAYMDEGFEVRKCSLFMAGGAGGRG